MLEFEPGWQDWLKAMELHPDIRKPLMAEPRPALQAERERLARRLSRTGLERSAVFRATTFMRIGWRGAVIGPEQPLCQRG